MVVRLVEAKHHVVDVFGLERQKTLVAVFEDATFGAVHLDGGRHDPLDDRTDLCRPYHYGLATDLGRRLEPNRRTCWGEVLTLDLDDEQSATRGPVHLRNQLEELQLGAGRRLCLQTYRTNNEYEGNRADETHGGSFGAI